METKKYDFTSMNRFFNEWYTPLELLDAVTDLAVNYALSVDEEKLDRFKQDMGTISLFIDEIRDLVNQDLR